MSRPFPHRDCGADGVRQLAAGGRKSAAGDQFDAARRTLVLLLAPFAPHIAEELWTRLGGAGSVHDQPWPAAQAEATVETIELPVQVDGRLRDHISLASGASEEAALARPKVREAIGGRAVRRVVVVPGRVVNVVTG
ncbi:MAG TPA: class I tRNA ligase family protein [Roseiflexaceae bacterium]